MGCGEAYNFYPRAVPRRMSATLFFIPNLGLVGSAVSVRQLVTWVSQSQAEISSWRGGESSAL